MLSLILNVAFAYCFSEHYYAECQYTECRYAECRGTVTVFITDHWVGPIFQWTNLACSFTATAHNHLSPSLFLFLPLFSTLPPTIPSLFLTHSLHFSLFNTLSSSLSTLISPYFLSRTLFSTFSNAIFVSHSLSLPLLSPFSLTHFFNSILSLLHSLFCSLSLSLSL